MESQVVRGCLLCEEGSNRGGGRFRVYLVGYLWEFYGEEGCARWFWPPGCLETRETETTIETEETSKTGENPMSENDKVFYKRTETQSSF